uniref:Calpain catalytic domain-containing protein n=1 Tax=Meloidogyne hapla TaxID=6305 RepID=A0A1I8BK46_MELHA
MIPDGQEWGSAGNEYAGIFQFCFWRFGRWIDVIIDDLLPCSKGGKLLFARSKTDNEFWSALLEKAFAKLYGCYENLVGGQLADALQDVSGGVAETLNVRRFISQHKKIMNGTEQVYRSLSKARNNLSNGNLASLSVYKTDGSASKRLFYSLKHAFNRGALIVSAISAKNDEVEKSLECGLGNSKYKAYKICINFIVMGHAYALTAIQFVELDVDKSIPDRGLYTNGKRQAICPNFSATFCFNPQFLLEVSGPGTAEVIFALNQPDQFYGKKRLPYLAVGMQLMRVELNRRQRLHRVDLLLRQPICKELCNNVKKLGTMRLEISAYDDPLYL